MSEYMDRKDVERLKLINVTMEATIKETMAFFDDVMNELRVKYALKDGDTVNYDTGVITRK